MPTENKIVIRCAQSSFTDVTVICPSDWTVLRLKRHLQDVCDAHPDPSRQKLIYSGRLLDKNDSLIAEYLRPLADGAESHCFHLVFTRTTQQLQQERQIQRDQHNQKAQSIFPKVSASKNISNEETIPPVSPSNSQQNFAELNAQWTAVQQQLYQAYLQQYSIYLQQLYGNNNYYPSLSSQSTSQSTWTFSPEAVNAQHIPNQPNGHAGPPAPQTVPLDQPQGAEQLNQAQNEQNRPIPLRQEPQMNMAQGGFAEMAEDDNDDGVPRERDFLEWLYIGLRASMFFTLLFFYSTWERLFFVSIMCLFVYAVQAGVFGRRRNVQDADNENEMANDQQQQQNEDRGRPDNVENEEIDSPENHTTEQRTDENGEFIHPDEDETFWGVFSSTCYLFITTFFASMLPEREPPQRNIN